MVDGKNDSIFGLVCIEDSSPGVKTVVLSLSHVQRDYFNAARLDYEFGALFSREQGFFKNSSLSGFDMIAYKDVNDKRYEVWLVPGADEIRISVQEAYVPQVLSFLGLEQQSPSPQSSTSVLQELGIIEAYRTEFPNGAVEFRFRMANPITHEHVARLNRDFFPEFKEYKWLTQKQSDPRHYLNPNLEVDDNQWTRTMVYSSGNMLLLRGPKEVTDKIEAALSEINVVREMATVLKYKYAFNLDNVSSARTIAQLICSGFGDFAMEECDEMERGTLHSTGAKDYDQKDYAGHFVLSDGSRIVVHVCSISGEAIVKGQVAAIIRFNQTDAAREFTSSTQLGLAPMEEMLLSAGKCGVNQFSIHEKSVDEQTRATNYVLINSQGGARLTVQVYPDGKTELGGYSASDIVWFGARLNAEVDKAIAARKAAEQAQPNPATRSSGPTVIHENIVILEVERAPSNVDFNLLIDTFFPRFCRLPETEAGKVSIRRSLQGDEFESITISRKGTNLIVRKNNQSPSFDHFVQERAAKAEELLRDRFKQVEVVIDLGRKPFEIDHKILARRFFAWCEDVTPTMNGLWLKAVSGAQESVNTRSLDYGIRVTGKLEYVWDVYDRQRRAAKLLTIEKLMIDLGKQPQKEHLDRLREVCLGGAVVVSTDAIRQQVAIGPDNDPITLVALPGQTKIFVEGRLDSLLELGIMEKETKKVDGKPKSRYVPTGRFRSGETAVRQLSVPRVGSDAVDPGARPKEKKQKQEFGAKKAQHGAKLKPR
ncbi:MAG: hypothetical protein ABII22_02940 [Candidatus Micrarchaeota archaeon]